MKKWIKRIVSSLGLLFLIGYLILFLLPIPPLLSDVSFSQALYDNNHKLLRLTLNNEDKYRLFTPFKKIPKQLIEATLLQEDQYFYWHSGVNPWSLLKAMWHTYVLKSRTIGASTITMQLARIHFAINSRHPLGKLAQIIRALQIEIHYSKERILEAYLNRAPYGGNIEGVGAASLVYFHQSIEQITLPQALVLSIIPQNPNKRTPQNNDLKKIRDLLFVRWLAHHPEDNKNSSVFSLPLVLYSLKQLPFRSPHLTNMLLANHSNKELNTTLDSRLQAIIERVTQRYLARKKNLGIANAAVLLVDARDMSIKSMLGSADFFKNNIAGQINGIAVKRSPGSTLKPFIYGLALDQGLIHPNTVLYDVPSSFNGYNPENFDYDFIGPVKAKDALILSRNIPAIYLSSLLKNTTLYQLLEQAQITHLKPESYYGLALNLGGVELTLNELVGLYAMLVNEGVWYPIHALTTDKKTKGRRILSREASFLVLDMLQDSTYKDVYDQVDSSIPIAWKTGTSSGYRDAWTLGSFGPYVLGVWIGNFDNKANPALIGKEIAAPLFFELIAAIEQEVAIPRMTNPPDTMNLKKIKVCSASGMLPTRYCPQNEWTWFIPGKSPIKTDTVFREVAINSKTGLRTCHIDEYTRFEVFEFWPSDLLSIFKQAGIQKRIPPFFEANCALTANNGLSPRITSPQAGISYIMRLKTTSHNKIPLTAVTDAGIEYLYWFINNSFIAKVNANEAYLWQAKPGVYTLRVVDDRGLSSVQRLNILVEN